MDSSRSIASPSPSLQQGIAGIAPPIAAQLTDRPSFSFLLYGVIALLPAPHNRPFEGGSMTLPANRQSLAKSNLLTHWSSFPEVLPPSASYIPPYWHGAGAPSN